MNFSYKLYSHGWAESRVWNDWMSHTMRVSYLSDALGDLLTAVLLIAKGSPDARCSFADEPGENRWVFKRYESQVHVRVLWLDSELWYSDAVDRDGKLVFEAVVSVRSLMSTVRDELQEILDEHGLDGYLDQWGEAEFPLDRFRRLERLLEARQLDE